MAQTKLSKLDLHVRLLMIKQCLCETGLKLKNKQANGGDCTELERTFKLLSALLDVICRFDPFRTEPCCITEDQMDDIFETISRICGICFPAKGSSIPSPTNPSVPPLTLEYTWMAWRESAPISLSTQHYLIVDQNGCPILAKAVVPSGW